MGSAHHWREALPRPQRLRLYRDRSPASLRVQWPLLRLFGAVVANGFAAWFYDGRTTGPLSGVERTFDAPGEDADVGDQDPALQAAHVLLPWIHRVFSNVKRLGLRTRPMGCRTLVEGT